ncbi:MAG: hypothetical protein RL173_3655 [Fibrobacterota bacterium]|jgi:hypothetical protein
MIMPKRIPALSLWLVAIGLWSCGDDRISSGSTSGTQTGNALQARLLLSDGRPAAATLVVARGSQATDSTDPVTGTTTDSDGRFEMRLPDGDWTFEATREGLALRMDLHLNSDTTLSPDTLAPTGALQGVIQGVGAGQSLSLPGLGRRIVPDSDGRFRFGSLARGTHPLRLSGSAASWSVTVLQGRTDTILLDATRSGETFEAIGAPTVPSDRSGPTLLVQSVGAQSQGSLGDLEWTTSNGTVVASLALDRDANAGTVRAWVRPPSTGDLLCRRVVVGSARASSPFADHRLAVVFPAPSGFPDSLGTDSVLNYADSSVFAGFGPTTSFGFLAGEGWYRRSPLGSLLASMDVGSRPTGTRWNISMRIAQEYPEIGRIWLLDASGSGADALKIGIGAGVLELVAPGIDTTISVNPSSEFHDWTVTSDGSIVWVRRDGQILVKANIVVDAANWTRCDIGLGGGVRLSRLFVSESR